jgi:hypothetical protein
VQNMYARWLIDYPRSYTPDNHWKYMMLSDVQPPLPYPPQPPLNYFRDTFERPPAPAAAAAATAAAAVVAPLNAAGAILAAAGAAVVGGIARLLTPVLQAQPAPAPQAPDDPTTLSTTPRFRDSSRPPRSAVAASQQPCSPLQL